MCDALYTITDIGRDFHRSSHPVNCAACMYNVCLIPYIKVTYLDHVVNGEGGPHRSSGSQCIRQSKMSEM